MANSSILGGERAANLPAGKDVAALGPRDNSDSGSDSIGLAPAGSDTDANGTGERAAVEGAADDGADITADHTINTGRVGRSGQIDAPEGVENEVEARDFAVEQARSNDA